MMMYFPSLADAIPWCKGEEEFCVALVGNVVEIGHEHEVAVRRWERLADFLGVPRPIRNTECLCSR
jgi:hypothetical protein